MRLYVCCLDDKKDQLLSAAPRGKIDVSLSLANAFNKQVSEAQTSIFDSRNDTERNDLN